MTRNLYKDVLSPDTLALIEADLGEEDRYNVQTECALGRLYMRDLLQLRKNAESKYAGKPEIMMEISARIAQAVEQHVKTLKYARDVDAGGAIFTSMRVAGLIEKCCSLVMLHVSNLEERENVVCDIMDMCSSFLSPATQGTLITPDQDANLMDNTVPYYDDEEHNILTIDGPGVDL